VRNVPAAARVAPGARVERIDLEEPGAAAELVEALRPSHVFNLAGYGIDRGERDEHRADRLNHRLVREIAEACAPDARWSGAVLVHAGSAAEYGDVGGVFSEAGPVHPTSLYGRTKLAGTLALSEVAHRRGTRAVTARLFTVFGDGEHPGRLFPTLRTGATTSVPVELSDGRQARDFAFVGDVVAALAELAHLPFVAGEIVNIASGRLYTVEWFVRVVARTLRMPEAQLEFGALPSRPDELYHTGVSVDRMRELFGHALPSDLTEIVTRALA
jgi:nucleoside-diphosphate-sugar epimerase